MTPLIDVVFLLLIFFMISTTFITNPGIKVQLPLASSKSTINTKPIEVVITRENRIFLDGKSLSLERLQETIIQKKRGSIKDQVLILKADGQVQHRLVVNVLDIAKQAGIKKLSIATEPKRK